jgi:hypothetical protein
MDWDTTQGHLLILNPALPAGTRCDGGRYDDQDWRPTFGGLSWTQPYNTQDQRVSQLLYYTEKQ